MSALGPQRPSILLSAQRSGGYWEEPRASGLKHCCPERPPECLVLRRYDAAVHKQARDSMSEVLRFTREAESFLECLRAAEIAPFQRAGRGLLDEHEAFVRLCVNAD